MVNIIKQLHADEAEPAVKASPGSGSCSTAAPSMEAAGLKQILDSCRSSNEHVEWLKAWCVEHDSAEGSLEGASEAVQELVHCLETPELVPTALSCLTALTSTAASDAVISSSALSSSLHTLIHPQTPHTPAALTLYAKLLTTRPEAFDPSHASALTSAAASSDAATQQQAATAIAAASSTDAGAAAFAALPDLPSTLCTLITSKQGLFIKHALLSITNLSSSSKAFQAAATQHNAVQTCARLLRLHHSALADHAAVALAAILRNNAVAQDTAAAISLHVSLLQCLQSRQLQKPEAILDALANLVLKHAGNQGHVTAAKGHLPLLQLLCNKDPQVGTEILHQDAAPVCTCASDCMLALAVSRMHHRVHRGAPSTQHTHPSSLHAAAACRWWRGLRALCPT
jgi:hypothetical protein